METTQESRENEASRRIVKVAGQTLTLNTGHLFSNPTPIRSKLVTAVKKQIYTNWVASLAQNPGCQACKSELAKLLRAGVTYAQIVREQIACRFCRNPLLPPAAKPEKPTRVPNPESGDLNAKRQGLIAEPPLPRAWAMQPLAEGAEEHERQTNLPLPAQDNSDTHSETSSTASSFSDVSDDHFQHFEERVRRSSIADAQQHVGRRSVAESVGPPDKAAEKAELAEVDHDVQRSTIEAEHRLHQLSDEYVHPHPPEVTAAIVDSPVGGREHSVQDDGQAGAAEPPSGVPKLLADVPVPDEKAVSIKGLTRVTVRRIIGNSAILHLLNEEEVEELMRYVIMNRYPKNHRILLQGDHGDVFFTVATGEVDAYVDGAWMARYGEGDVVGEVTLGSKRRRKYTVVASKQVTCMEISSPVMEFVLRKRPELWTYLVELARERHTVARRLRRHGMKLRGNQAGETSAEGDTAEQATSAETRDSTESPNANDGEDGGLDPVHSQESLLSESIGSHPALESPMDMTSEEGEEERQVETEEAQVDSGSGEAGGETSVEATDAEASEGVLPTVALQQDSGSTSPLSPGPEYEIIELEPSKGGDTPGPGVASEVSMEDDSQVFSLTAVKKGPEPLPGAEQRFEPPSTRGVEHNASLSTQSSMEGSMPADTDGRGRPEGGDDGTSSVPAVVPMPSDGSLGAASSLHRARAQAETGHTSRRSSTSSVSTTTGAGLDFHHVPSALPPHVEVRFRDVVSYPHRETRLFQTGPQQSVDLMDWAHHVIPGHSALRLAVGHARPSASSQAGSPHAQAPTGTDLPPVSALRFPRKFSGAGEDQLPSPADGSLRPITRPLKSPLAAWSQSRSIPPSPLPGQGPGPDHHPALAAGAAHAVPGGATGLRRFPIGSTLVRASQPSAAAAGRRGLLQSSLGRAPSPLFRWDARSGPEGTGAASGSEVRSSSRSGPSPMQRGNNSPKPRQYSGSTAHAAAPSLSLRASDPGHHEANLKGPGSGRDPLAARSRSALAAASLQSRASGVSEGSGAWAAASESHPTPTTMLSAGLAGGREGAQSAMARLENVPLACPKAQCTIFQLQVAGAADGHRRKKRAVKGIPPAAFLICPSALK